MLNVEGRQMDCSCGDRLVRPAVATTGQLINVADVADDQRFYPGVDAQTGYQTRNLVATPLLNLNGRILGVFEVLNKLEGSFTRADEELLTAFAAQAAIAVETAAMVEDLRDLGTSSCRRMPTCGRRSGGNSPRPRCSGSVNRCRRS